VLSGLASYAQKVDQPQCAVDLAHCKAAGCSSDNHHDPKLNKLKNVEMLKIDKPLDVSLDWIKERPDPTKYKIKGKRKELRKLGEGKVLRVVGYLLAVKMELGGESCNCYIRTEADTDNHLVLVTKATLDAHPLPPNADEKTLKKVFALRERESVTVEFTPRVRKHHPKFTNPDVQPMIDKTQQGALLVRITGPLMFDSEHFFEHQLRRVNNWEVHPVFRFEYCPEGKACTDNGTENWVDLDK
jgi:hypothetical protein